MRSFDWQRTTCSASIPSRVPEILIVFGSSEQPTNIINTINRGENAI
jgi:hypothetical protein